MDYSKESLEKLLNLISEISSDSRYDWFKQELHQQYGAAGFKGFPGFVKYLRKTYKVKANEFYKKIENDDLRNELIRDHIEMQWYQAIQDNERFLLYTYYQLENLLNHYCLIAKAFDKIRANPNYYSYKFSNKMEVVCFDKFLHTNKEPKQLEKINSIWAKIAFWILDAGKSDWYTSNRNSNFWNLSNIRNKMSHRNSSAANNERVINALDFLNKQDLSGLTYYLNILKEVIKTFEAVDPKVKSLTPDKPKLPGLKIVNKKIYS